jgi:trans-2,3-dihydro-3-hydroxyanthranilate isomerase
MVFAVAFAPWRAQRGFNYGTQMERRYALLNVFTREPLGGNPLAVVTDTKGLNNASMQAIAHKLNYSETVFVFPPQNPAHTASIRIFTPEAEVPFAGHPTIGTAIFMAQERWQKAGAEFDALVVLEEKAGVLRIAVKPGKTAFAEFDALQMPQESGESAPNDRLAAALGLAPTEIGFENFKPLRLSAGVPFTFVPVKDLKTINRAHVVDSYWKSAFADEMGAAYLYCRETVRYKAAFHARVFAPLVGVPEDPATGSAAAAFVGVINQFDAPPDGTYSIMIEQGIEMGRPCEIYLEMEIANRQIRAVRIGGHAIFVTKSIITIS